MAFFEADADSTAKKATQDSLGNVISSTYVKDLSASGSTVTVTRGDDTTFTFETQGGSSNLATPKTDGLMSAKDKAKLDAIEEGANNTTVDEELSATSTNPLQNRAINTALNLKANTDHNHDSKYLSLDGGTVKGDITATSFTGDLNGSATKLANARTVQVNLASTSYATFDGTNNITPGVVGILPMANGGLGTNKAEVARKNLEIAPTYAEFEPSSSTYNGLIWIGDGADADSVTYEKATVDSALSLTSENPVQNKVVTEAVTSLQNSLPFKLAISEDGVYGYIKDGADTVTPFLSATNSIKESGIFDAVNYSGSYTGIASIKYQFDSLDELERILKFLSIDNFFIHENKGRNDGSGYGGYSAITLSSSTSVSSVKVYNYFYHGYVREIYVNKEKLYFYVNLQKPRVITYLRFNSNTTNDVTKTLFLQFALQFFTNQIHYINGSSPSVYTPAPCCSMNFQVYFYGLESSSVPNFSLKTETTSYYYTSSKSNFTETSVEDSTYGTVPVFNLAIDGREGTTFTSTLSSIYVDGYSCNVQCSFFPVSSNTSTMDTGVIQTISSSSSTATYTGTLNPPVTPMLRIYITYYGASATPSTPA